MRSGLQQTDTLSDEAASAAVPTSVDVPSILVPSLTTDARGFVTPGFLESDVIVTNLAFVIFDAQPWLFSTLSSSLHATWTRTVSGRFRVGVRYSSNISYNTFPMPTLSRSHKEALDEHAWNIIGAREAFPGKTIDWLYNPDTMPQLLLEAHRALDDTLDKIYVGRPFKNDTERLEHLFDLYSEMTSQSEEAANA
jgi:hypothetical protein